MLCPFCRSEVTMIGTPQGLLCPACRNTGLVAQAAAPPSRAGLPPLAIVAIVIGVVVLGIAVVVVLAATVFVLVSDIGATPPPEANLLVAGDPEHDRIIISHAGGQILVEGTFEVSVTLGSGSADAFRTCQGRTPAAEHFRAGDQITVFTTTEDPSSSCDLTTNSVDGGPLLAATTYRVVVRDVASGGILVDRDVFVG